MTILYSKLKIKQHEIKLKRRLFHILINDFRTEMATQWNPEIATKIVCSKVYIELKNIEVYTLQTGEDEKGRYCFLNELLKLKIALMNRDYEDICHALLTMVKRNSISREVIRTHVVQLLQQYLEE